MTDLNKLNRLREILLYRHSVASRESTFGAIGQTNSASLQISSDTGVSVYFEYAGDPSRNDHKKIAPTNQYVGYEDEHRFRHSKMLAQWDLQDFLHGLNVPELRDEFTKAIAKIARKANAIKRHGRYIASTNRRDGVTAERIEERLAGNPLYEITKGGCSRDDEKMRAYMKEAFQIVDELGLSERFGYRDENGEYYRKMPSYHEVNQLYHETKRELKTAPK